ncbi:hypothetical protein D9611_013015 [Ephemerocybe angulata]|uniref:Uncharacterized protein n=1 Tax=Ephemerocybe angulata TaxID=980116 RepID=A0A8H5AVE3_9AGAR|nr:hypothetical protein D9611_013015 [Tulosesus angulatus]
MAPIYLCPPELHSYIASFVCLIDSGRSIRSFSLVSRYFQQITEPYLFHTVSATGTPNLLALDSSIRRTGCPLGARHLYLAPCENTPSRGPNKPLIQAIQNILARAHPTLETLTLDLSSSPHESTLIFSHLFRTSFPRLRALALSGFYPNPNTSTVNFPKLRRLHLSGNRNPCGLLHAECLPAAFPQLEELRISGLSMAVAFALEIEGALHSSSSRSPFPSYPGTPTTNTPGPYPASIFDSVPHQTSPALSLPATLKTLSICPSPTLGQTISSRSSVLKNKAMMSTLRRVGNDAGGKGKVKFILEDRAALQTGDLRKDWEEAMEGKVSHS